MKVALLHGCVPVIVQVGKLVAEGLVSPSGDEPITALLVGHPSRSQVVQ
jgi:hypothetical protein